MPEEQKMVSDKELARKPDEESDGTASDDESSEKDGDSDGQLHDENSIISSESKEEEEKKKKKKAKKEKTKKKGKKKKEKKDKKEKDKKKKKLPPVQAPDYVHVQQQRASTASAHSRVSMVSAITIPKPLAKLAKTHTGPLPKDHDYPTMTSLERDVSNFTLPNTLTIGMGDQVDDSQRSARVSLLGDDSTRSSAWRNSLDPNTSLLDG